MTQSEPGFYGGKHYTEWVDELDGLRSEKRDDESIELLLHLCDAAEEESAEHGGGKSYPPPPGYYRRLAVLYRKRNDLGAAVKILERWHRAAGRSPTRDPSDELVKAREMLRAAKDAAKASSACPHCNIEIDPHPTRTKACPHCKETVVATKVKGADRCVLSTPEQRDARKAEATEKKQADQLLDDARRVDATEADVERVRTQLRTEFGGVPPGDNDVIWRLANERLADVSRRDDWGGKVQVYSAMERLLKREGRDSSEMQWERECAERQKYAAMACPDGEVTIVACSCRVCAGDNGLRMPGPTAVRKAVLPHAKCERGKCGCRYDVRVQGRSAPSFSILRIFFGVMAFALLFALCTNIR